jgi:hypothetical protein
MIRTDLVYNNTLAAEAYKKFPNFAQKAFQPVYSVFEKWHWLRFIMTLLKDGSYDSGALDRTIQNICQQEC